MGISMKEREGGREGWKNRKRIELLNLTLCVVYRHYAKLEVIARKTFIPYQYVRKHHSFCIGVQLRQQLFIYIRVGHFFAMFGISQRYSTGHNKKLCPGNHSSIPNFESAKIHG